MGERQWLPIGEAPKTGAPVWVRGWDWGKVGGAYHHTWAHWDGTNWIEAGTSGEHAQGGSTLLYLTDYMPGAR